jgi:hypothetical protein
MKYKKFMFILLVLFGATQLWALNFNKTLGDAAFEGTTSQAPVVTTQTKAEYSAEAGLASLAAGTGYVGVFSYLNVRDAVWGNIIGSLTNNEPVNIIGAEGDWYKINYNGSTAYVHARYIFDAKDKRYRGSEVTEANRYDTAGPILNVPGSGSGAGLKGNARVVQEANNLVSRYSRSSSFPYDPLTKGGSLGCAQVVTTALKAAGVNIGIDLSCLSTKSKLLKQGYRSVSVPPYQAGDVIFWATYDRTGNGRNDADTHIGIVMNSGNNVQAMSNSSSQKRPRIHSATYAPVTTVLRPA